MKKRRNIVDELRAQRGPEVEVAYDDLPALVHEIMGSDRMIFSARSASDVWDEMLDGRWKCGGRRVEVTGRPTHREPFPAARMLP